VTTIKEHLAVIGGLSTPNKMPCYAWSIPAKHCITGKRLAERTGTVCSHCYALKGRYMMPNTVAAMNRRYRILMNALGNYEAREKFTHAFSEVLLMKQQNYLGGPRDPDYFRWFDSGDLQSYDHLSIIADIADETPTVQFWLPTREHGIVHKWHDVEGKFPANLNVRLSHTMVDQVVTTWPAPGFTYSGVHTGPRPPSGFTRCIAPDQGDQCGQCRACWHDPAPISYELH
jgi:hypothetical protein